MLKAKIIPYDLNFISPAGTSRGIMKIKKSWVLAVKDLDSKNIGYGEFSVIENLSPDWNSEYESLINEVAGKINSYHDLDELISNFKSKPSIIFALETAKLDLENKGRREIFNTDFYSSEKRIPINGLIWMNDKETMLNSIQDKLNQGYNCIKLKIGAINYADEIELLQSIRTQFSKEKIEIRVDANGSFDFTEAPSVLNELANLDIHSIEQPIKQGQIGEMAALCKSTPIPIALDEELIGIHTSEEKTNLLDSINPQYIILKPSLHGGISGSQEWIALAEERNIGWWMTSALESNIGLNAISQFASSYHTQMYQGLGTGGLYTNNISSPLTVENGQVYYNLKKDWELPKSFSF